MSDVPANETRLDRVVALLQDNLRTVLARHVEAADLDLTDEEIAFMANDLADEVLYAFSIDWAPRWVAPGQVHSWEGEKGFIARCGVCLVDSPPYSDRTEAQTWATHHESAHR